VAASATTYLVAWRSCSGQQNVYGQVVDASGQTPFPPFAIDESPRVQDNPAVAASDDQFLVVWDSEMETSTSRSIYAQRFTASGTAIGSAWITSNGFEPAVTFDGTNYLIVWVTNGGAATRRNVRATRMAADGVVLDPMGITVAQTTVHEDATSVACGGGVCLAVWRRGSSEIRAARIGPDGDVLDPNGFFVGTFEGLEHATAVAYDGEGFLVAWRTGAGVIHGATVGVDGDVTNAAGLLVSTPTPIDRPALASNGTGQVIAVYDRFDPSPAYHVRRVRTREVTPAASADAGIGPDAGAADARLPDARLPDAVVHDAALPDARLPDAGLPDAHPPDAAVPDARLPDAGLPDAFIPDADRRDANAPSPDAATPNDGDGCQTTSAPTATSVLWFAICALVLGRRRLQRRQRARDRRI